MHSVLSGVFGGVLVVLIYGLSFFPSATLDQREEAEEVGSREGVNTDAENAARAGGLRKSGDGQSDAC
jgi:hypothetical protein